MNLDVEICGLAEPLGAVQLRLPSHLAEAGALRLVAVFKGLFKSGITGYILDLSQTELLTGSGLGAIHHLFREAKGKLVLLGPNEKTQRLFGVSGLAAPVAFDLKEAQDKLKEVV
ncbi:MAG: hypothetical protein A2600_10230 [Candidatus Lambdaproteobacteria bacterium RIFOXYD1_FULL_56_27]|uniref:STAS domain-containing protein n=1 Tax=Candidatus Lambdaproteobacteria bacterium RIFOXYD2_FULL_56_26 TaxID=1817773 RepID=A0A1F6GQM5_9PROT|nr:MAG: hypothetical protein A2557_09455 [Candidatus Lambdaproteobacteria bacterium RIFOXYD2_FULL_56_26]OGH04154.1 MAG: hypothetical protein A2426_02845 [Candidatus Lambdaproteobacteria bacterium RIFOXYC1_FULL_56_13]OGH06329.1 MAG: hypothetical protein A2600_10230 [Candidatus Lambdaproteobacteria bacterium RIFOXYD1_FULL_56_27]